ncbi:MAG: long-chain fatty acid--CoA ligase, partial [Clostridia bacterium]|nr:long-chain fatty acid--CoA ligase [Clostridia bacterium]
METPWIHQYDSWFKPSMSYPELTLYETVARTANRFPDHPALSFMGRKITYSELMSEIDQAAAGLEADGFSTGQVMTICLPN